MISKDGKKIRFADKQRLHVAFFHPEVFRDVSKIEATLKEPDLIAKGSERSIEIYYRYFEKTVVGGKYLAVVVKLTNGEGFILTAYFTSRTKKVITWRKERS